MIQLVEGQHVMVQLGTHNIPHVVKRGKLVEIESTVDINLTYKEYKLIRNWYETYRNGDTISAQDISTIDKLTASITKIK